MWLQCGLPLIYQSYRKGLVDQGRSQYAEKHFINYISKIQVCDAGQNDAGKAIKGNTIDHIWGAQF